MRTSMRRSEVALAFIVRAREVLALLDISDGYAELAAVTTVPEKSAFFTDKSTALFSLAMAANPRAELMYTAYVQVRDGGFCAKDELPPFDADKIGEYERRVRAHGGIFSHSPQGGSL